jgi:hypothetical protein
MKNANKIFKEIYDLCQKILDTCNYDSSIINISDLALNGMDISKIKEEKFKPNELKGVSNNEHKKIFCFRCHSWEIKNLKNYYLCKDCNLKWAK